MGVGHSSTVGVTSLPSECALVFVDSIYPASQTDAKSAEFSFVIHNAKESSDTYHSHSVISSAVSEETSDLPSAVDVVRVWLFDVRIYMYSNNDIMKIYCLNLPAELCGRGIESRRVHAVPGL